MTMPSSPLRPAISSASKRSRVRTPATRCWPTSRWASRPATGSASSGGNGGGKSTLLRADRRLDEPDAGRRHAQRRPARRHARPGRRPRSGAHDPAGGDRRARRPRVGRRRAHPRRARRAARRRRARRGSRTASTRSIAPLSGGERRRIALAKLLLAGPDLLLLDEPTNHLDVEGVDWLARHLRARRGALVVVTHDRWFLDAVCTRTWEVDRRHDVHQYDGGYAAWVLARAERDRIAAATEERRQNLLRKELAWLRRGPPARTSKPRFRIDAANALIADEPAPRDRVELLQVRDAPGSGESVVDVEDVERHARRAPRCSAALTWRLGPGDRVGARGRQRLAARRRCCACCSAASSPTAARCGAARPCGRRSSRRSSRTSTATCACSSRSRRCARRIALGRRPRADGARSCASGSGSAAAGSGRTSRDLSGGERRRLQLMRLLMGEPNLLVLDEPSNDLDIDTLLALEDLLDGWPGHAGGRQPRSVPRRARVRRRLRDRRRRLTLRHLPGGIDQYLDERRAEAPPPPPPPPRASRADARRAGAPGAPRRVAAGARAGAARDPRGGAARADGRARDRLRARRPTLDGELRALLGQRAVVEDAWLAAAALLDG